MLLGMLFFYTNIELDDNTLVTNKNRVIIAIFIKKTLDEAVYRVYKGVKNIYFKNKYF